MSLLVGRLENDREQVIVNPGSAVLSSDVYS